jgi:hypothetical protein
MLAGGLLVAGGASAVNLGTYATADCTTFTPSSPVYGAPGDTFVMTNTGGTACGPYTSQVSGALTLSGSTLGASGSTDITVTLNSSSSIEIGGVPFFGVIVSSPSAVPSLSEWAQLMLALMVMTVIGWRFHRERSY